MTPNATPEQFQAAGKELENFILLLINTKMTGHKFKIGLFPPAHHPDTPVYLLDGVNTFDADILEDLKTSIVKILQQQAMRHLVKFYSFQQMAATSKAAADKERGITEYNNAKIYDIVTQSRLFLDSDLKR